MPNGHQGYNSHVQWCSNNFQYPSQGQSLPQLEHTDSNNPQDSCVPQDTPVHSQTGNVIEISECPSYKEERQEVVLKGSYCSFN